VVEELLQLLVGVIDAQLLEGVQLQVKASSRRPFLQRAQEPKAGVRRWPPPCATCTAGAPSPALYHPSSRRLSAGAVGLSSSLAKMF
jgi:hypothetical protein